MIRFNDITIERDKHTVWHGARSHTFSSCDYKEKNRYCSIRLVEALLLGNGYTIPELFNILYEDDPNGGPIQGRKQIDVMLYNLKPVFEKLRLQLKSHRHNSLNVYRLVPLCGSIETAA